MATNPPSTPVPATKPAAGPAAREDQLLALLLTTIWATRTGRELPPVPVSELSPAELMDFWADDQLDHPPRRLLLRAALTPGHGGSECGN
jgi:hypothetical protein